MKKLTSRKLWLAIAGIATGIAVMLGVDSSEIKEVSGALMSVASIITYIITEGKIDAAKAENASAEEVEEFDFK